LPFLFDTDAVTEVLKRRPAPIYLRWLAGIPRSEQFTSAVVIGELYKGAFRSLDRERHLQYIDTRVLPTVTVLPYDLAVSRVFGQIQADLAREGRGLADADLQIAATAIHHGLELVTGNVRHFRRIPGIRLEPILDEARKRG
jgi:predicted nucleic acid-binding protein